MLVISRRPGESVVITTAHGDRIRITVIPKTGRRSYLGFSTEGDFKIVREESLLESELFELPLLTAAVDPRKGQTD